MHNSYENSYSSKKRRNQQRAFEFRTQRETTRVIKLIDARGNKKTIRQQGRMGLTTHANIISALEKRAMRYHNKVQYREDPDVILYDAAVDETGTIDTASLTDSDAETLGEQQ